MGYCAKRNGSHLSFAVAQAVAERYPRVSLSASLASTGQLEGWLANLAANLVAPLVDGGGRAGGPGTGFPYRVSGGGG